jgi:preprotein translocase subunit SecB
MEKDSIKNYQEFLRNLYLESIEIIELTARKDENFFPNANISADIENKYKNDENSSFKVYSSFALNAKQKDENNNLDISIVYLLKYKTKIVLDDEIFKIFESTYLPLTIYPYFRHIIQDITCKMGLPPLTLDLIKVNLVGKTRKKVRYIEK